MNSGLSASNPTLAAAFMAALLHQGIVVLVLLAALAVAWASAREWLVPARPAPAAGARPAAAGSTSDRAAAEPAGRRLLRIGFGSLWVFDGLLQAQPGMAAGLPSRVIEPAAASSPGWVQHLVNWAGTTWSYHPVQAAASVVWIQVGIGAWMIAAPAGRSARLAGLVSAGWGVVIWVFGEAFGAIFAPGLTVMSGAPGAAALYCAAGGLLALPDRCWHTAQPGRRVLQGTGLFLAGLAVLQAWPGRGFWPGTVHGRPATLTSMIESMSGTPQPRLLAGWVTSFGSVAAAHGFAVNLVAVIALAAMAAGLLSRQPRLIRITIIVLIAGCLADWVLIQDLGFLGGLGTDPGSMIPIALLASGGYLALSRVPAAATGPAGDRAGDDAHASAHAGDDAHASAHAGDDAHASAHAGDDASAHAHASDSDSDSDVRPDQRLRWRERARPGPLARAFGAASTRTVLAAWAGAMVVLGAAPLAVAQASPNADAIIARAFDGSSAPMDRPAPGFSLTDQHGRAVSLASLRGKVVLLTFLDPVCTSDCPLIAQEFRGADRVLGARSRDVELVAVNANPLYRAVAYTRAFDRQEGLGAVPNWLYLTGTLAQLSRIWRGYDVAAQVVPAGGMIAHADVAYIIDARGHTRAELDFDPGPGTASSVSSFAVELCDAARQYLRSS